MSDEDKYLDPDTNPFIRKPLDDGTQAPAEISPELKKQFDDAAKAREAQEAAAADPRKNPFIPVDRFDEGPADDQGRAPFKSDDRSDELKAALGAFKKNYLNAGEGLILIRMADDNFLHEDGRRVAELTSEEISRILATLEK
jgi:hypothetical protein